MKCQIIIMGQEGRIDLTEIEDFEVQRVIQPVQFQRNDGVLIKAELPRGWNGKIKLQNPINTLLNYEYTMYQYSVEIDGSVSTYQFNGTTFHFKSPTEIEFRSGSRRKI